MKRSSIFAATVLLAGCATVAPSPAGPAKINPASLAAAPAQWDGKEVEVTGLLVWEFERLRLFQSYGAYCRDAETSSMAWIGPDGLALRRPTIAGWSLSGERSPTFMALAGPTA